MVETKKGRQVFLICGEDEFRVNQRARECVDACCPEADQAFGLEIVDGDVGTVDEAVAAVQRAIDGLRTVGFLTGGKTVWFKDVNFLSQTPTGRSETVKSRLETLIDLLKKGLSDGQYLIVSAPKVYKSSAFYKCFKACASIEHFEVEAQGYRQEKQALEQAVELFKQACLKISRHELLSFVERTGMNGRQMSQDIEKLRLYLGESGVVDREALDLLVAPTREAMMWSIADAVGGRDIAVILKLLNQLFYQKESPVGMVIILERHFSRLAIIRSCMDRGWLQVRGGSREETQWQLDAEGEALLDGLGKDDPRKGHPFRLLVAVRQAKLFSTRELVWCREKIVTAHRNMLMSPVPPELILELAVMEIAGRRILARKSRDFAAAQTG
jgi:DNA polymerase-3 subunit delta